MADAPQDHATIEGLTKIRASILAIDGTIHPSVAVAALTVVRHIFATRRTRTAVKTKDAIVALIDALREEIDA